MAYKLALPKGVEKQIREAKIPARDLARVVSEYVSQQTRPVSQSGVIDLQPADNG